MTSFAPLNAETLEDRRRYLEGHLVDVACLDCLAVVRVRKQSEFHTSIQWDDESSAQCSELNRARVENPHRVAAACGRLSASIRSAVREGRLPIGGTVD